MENSQSHIGAHGEHGSLAPVQTRRRLSVEDEADLMNRGRGRQLAGIAVGAVALCAVAVLTIRHLGEAQAYADAATAAAQIEHAHFEGYLLCALPGATGSQLTSATRVHTLFERVGDQLGKRYAATLRACHPRLDALATQVAQLPVPDALAAEHTALSSAVAQLDTAQAAYQSYLDDASKPYQFVTSMPLIEKIELAYQAYRDAHKALVSKLNVGI